MRVLASAIMFVVMAVGISGQSAQKPKKFLTAPLTIEDQGSFFIGGVQKVTYQAAPTPPNQPLAPHQITIGQMYVQFQIPAKKYGGWPVIMVHGSSHTAACLESTPDGREGWYPYFVRKGVPSYVVDQAGRGRSGFDESVIHEGEAKLVAGDPKDRDTFIGPMISEGEARRLDKWIQEAVGAGATLLCGGKREGAMLEATLLENVDRACSVYREEAFGPVAILSSFTDFDAALDEVNDSKFGLQAGIFTRDLFQMFDAWDRLDVGGVVINDVPSYRVDNMPYGGVKDSGLGREGIRFAMEDMTEIRNLVIRRRDPGQGR